MKKIIIKSLVAVALLFGVAGGITSDIGANEKAVAPWKIKAIAEGAKLMGVPYVWGGTSTRGFDCSGFIQYVYKKAGKTMPRTVAQQYKVGKPVAKANLRVGDLLYFQTYKAGPSHVGIYIGGGKFINASSSKGVSIADMNTNSYWKARYIGAKRLHSDTRIDS